jgi:WbqC-like protein family
MKLAISQPAYLPWSGYFDLIDQVDAFVLLDSVQFEKQSWQQRNRIKTPTGLQWLTVPVVMRERFGQLIKEVEIRDCGFAKKHLRAIELNYARATFFKDYFPELRLVLTCSSRSHLLDLNLRLIEWLMMVLGIRTRLFFSSSLGLVGKRTDLLAKICAHFGATQYISPLGSAAYLLEEVDILHSRSIEVLFQNYSHPEDRQMFPPFVPYASALDLVLNEGERAMDIVRSGRQPYFSAKQLTTELFANPA